MKAQTICSIAVAGLLAVVAVPSEAKGCLKGAAVGGVGGHVAGHHGLAGAGVGCLVGKHRAKKADEKAMQQEQQGQAVQQKQVPQQRS